MGLLFYVLIKKVYSTMGWSSWNIYRVNTNAWCPDIDKITIVR